MEEVKEEVKVEEPVKEEIKTDVINTDEEDMAKTKTFLKKLKEFFIEPAKEEVKVEEVKIDPTKYNELIVQLDQSKKEKEDLLSQLDQFKKLKDELEERVNNKELIAKKKEEVRDKSGKSSGDPASKLYETEDGKKLFYNNIVKKGANEIFNFKKDNPELAEKLLTEFNKNPKLFM